MFSIREKVTKDLEALRVQKVCGSSLEANLEIRGPSEALEVLKRYSDHLREFFIVSAVQIVEDNEVATLTLKSTRATGHKCPRCWHYSAEIDPEAQDTKGVCPKCRAALS